MAKNIPIKIALLLLVCCAIAIFPLLTITDSEFAGADGLAQEVIAEINPDYVPWFQNILEPPGTETESLLFALQASLGAAVLAYGFGYCSARRRFGNQAA